jgi:hypothetical protein
MAFQYSEIYSNFLDLWCGRYERSDCGTRSGIGFGRCFGVWEKVAKIILFISFERCGAWIGHKFDYNP